MSVAVTSSLPSPLQLLTVVVKPVSMTLMLGLITLALFVAAGQAEVVAAEWKTPPAMDTFTTYEDMQRYFDHRNQRTLRQIENPSDDSYLAAFNFHNEQEIHRTRRSAVEHKELPQKPKFYKFEMADAVEPSEEVKELIRQYKSRTFQQNDKYLETVPSSDNKKPIVKRTPSNNERASKSNNNFQKQAKRSTRPKRSTNYRQPANFKVQYIPFDVSDAREPDSQTKMLIKRMRALEIEKLAQDLPNPYPGVTANLDVPISAVSTTPKPSTKRPKYMKMKKAKRSKRGAPEMIKFELADARDSDTPSKPVVHTKKHTREAKDLQVDKKSEIDEESTQPKANDQSAQASKRYFVYKEAPAKVKKSVSALPHDVQNILSHLIKGNNAGKANVKYLPGKQVDYRAYQAPKFAQAYYGHGGGGGGGLGGYGKYGGGQVQAEKVQYVYQPVIVGGGGGGGHEGGGGAGIKYIGGGGHEGAGGGGEVKYVVAGGGGGGHEGGGGAGIKYIAGGGGGGHEGGGGGEVKYVAAGGGGSHEVGGDGGYGLKYVAAIGHGGGYAAGGEGGHGGGYAAGGEEGHGGGYGGGGAVAGHVIQYVAAGGGEHGGGYAAAEGGGGGHGGGYAAVGGHGGGYALIHGAGAGAHVNYDGYGGHAGGYEAAHGQAAAAIAHPIIVPEAGGGQNKEAAYDGGYGEDENGKNEGNQVIKNIPAPQFKAAQEDVYETKYSVVPTVEQYSNTPTQEFKLKLYSPESLLAKAQLEAKDRAKAAEDQILKAKAAAYAHGAGGGGEGYGGGGGHGGGYAAGGHGGGYGGGGHGGGYGGGGHGGGYAAGGHGGGYGGGGHGGGYAAGGHGGGYGGGAGEGGKGEGGAGAGPLIKIEYHAPAESLNENYKDIAEFKQLSSLVGKSPEDQIHGLTYLLAKEMQNRLHLQRQPNYGGGGHGGHGGGGGGGYAAEGGAASGEERPQDNKAPIQFHPDNGGQQLGGGGHYQALSAAPGKYIGLSKSQQYIPVIEQAGAVELKAGGGGGGGGGEEVKAAAGLGGEGGAGGKIAAPHSYMAYGLSPNYKGVGGLKGGGAIGHGQPGLGVSSYNGIHDAGYDEAAAKLQSYASKYAFGYRVRDFNTGNDFGHKQNRDVHGVTRGQYHILLPDGRIQNVIYHADDTGFHADVSFAGGQ